MVFTQSDAVKQAGSENKEQMGPSQEESKPADDPQWKRIKPYYLLLLIYAGILILGLIFRLCS